MGAGICRFFDEENGTWFTRARMRGREIGMGEPVYNYKDQVKQL